MSLRVMFDTNLYLSYLLLSTESSSIIKELFDRAFALEFELVIPAAVLNEVFEKVDQKPALASRISAESVRELEALIRKTTTVTPLRKLDVIPIVRDPDDDYLIAYAIAEQVDVLVSGDKDLLALGDSLAPLKIRSPQAFLDEVEGTDPAAVD